MGERQTSDSLEGYQEFGSERLAALVQNSWDILTIFDAEGRILYNSPAAQRIHGFAPEDLRNRDTFSFIHPEDVPKVQEAFDKIIAEPSEPQTVRYRYARKGGGWVWMEAVGSNQLRNPAIRGIVANSRDITDRMEPEAALRGNEAKYRALVETTGTGYVFLDDQGRVTDANLEYLRLTGRRALEEILGHEVMEWTAPHDLARNSAEIIKCFERGSVRNLEIDYVDPNGRIIPIEVNATVYQTPEGPRIVTLCKDITDRRRSEAALRESETRFRATFERASVGMFDSTPQGRFSHANPAFVKFIGYSEAELRDLSFREITHPEDLPASASAINECLDGSQTHLETEKRYIRKDGGVVWGHLHVTLVRDPSGAPRNFIGVLQDITERRRAEEALQESEEKFRTLFEAMTEGVVLQEVIQDPQGTLVDFRILDVNPAFEAHLGLSKKQLVGRKASETFGIDAPVFLGWCARVAAEGAPCGFENFFQSLKKHFRVGVFSPRKGYLATVFEDITGRKQAEEERARLEAEVQHAQKLEGLGRLAGGIAHDMNNVLAAIQGMASVLELKYAHDASLTASLATVLNASHRGRDLVKNLTDFARKGIEEPRPIDLNRLIREEVELLRHTTLMQVQISMDLEAPLPRIQGDPSSIGNILMNLCVNALDAMPQGGSLHFQTRSLPDGVVELMVKDTGTGMPPEVLAKATEPFFTTKPVGKGTGLGLSSVYGAMKAHGGSMELQSEEGKGTRVLLHFPSLVPQAIPLIPEAVLPDTASPRSLKILLVDDDELIRITFPPLAEILGHEVVKTAENGAEALRLFEDGLDVDVVVLDQNMPGLSGIEVLLRLRAQHPKLPVIISTGHLDESAAMSLQNRAHVWVLMKPYPIAELRKVLGEVIQE